MWDEKSKGILNIIIIREESAKAGKIEINKIFCGKVILRIKSLPNPLLLYLPYFESR